jgi:endoglucanase
MDRFGLWKSGELRGANAFPRHTVEDLRTLRSWGANLVAFGVDSVLDLDAPFDLKEDAFADIDTAISRAKEADLFAVINFRSAPGRKDFNKDNTMWTDYVYHRAFVRMWREVAQHLREAEIAGYDLMCEPHPEDLFPKMPDAERAALMKGTAADWNALVRETVKAIREVDRDTPIIVNSTNWSYPHTFATLDVVDDPRTVYSVHFYDPHYYTHQKPEDERTYPGFVKPDEPDIVWDKAAIERRLAPARAYQEKHGVPIFSGEFGCARYAPGADRWLADQFEIYDRWGWSSAYWDLRGWWVMDIEMNADPEDRNRYADTPLLRVFREYFGRDRVWPSG